MLAAGKRISAAHPPCKSELMLLCEKFQARFGDSSAHGSSLILLNEAAIELSVPRRRLYDIINVLEAVEVRLLIPRSSAEGVACIGSFDL